MLHVERKENMFIGFVSPTKMSDRNVGGFLFRILCSIIRIVMSSSEDLVKETHFFYSEMTNTKQ